MTRRLHRSHRLILGLLVALGIPAAFVGCSHEGSHHHRRPENIQEYLSHLDRTERDEYQKPQEVVSALALTPGMAVADLGSGSGYFTRRFAEAVTDRGTVYAIDVEPDMLAYVKQSMAHVSAPARTEYVLAGPDDPKLPPQAVDLVFICNTYHHLEDRTAYFTTLKSALKPGGRIAIVDFHHDERSGNVGFPRRHLIPRDTVVSELTAAGYRLTKEHTFLPRQYFLEFTP